MLPAQLQGYVGVAGEKYIICCTDLIAITANKQLLLNKGSRGADSKERAGQDIWDVIRYPQLVEEFNLEMVA